MASPALRILFEFGEHGRAFGIAPFGVEGMRVGAGVDFANTGADACRRFDLIKFGVDEHAADNSGVGEPLDGLLEFGSPARRCRGRLQW